MAAVAALFPAPWPKPRRETQRLRQSAASARCTHSCQRLRRWARVAPPPLLLQRRQQSAIGTSRFGTCPTLAAAADNEDEEVEQEQTAAPSTVAAAARSDTERSKRIRLLRLGSSQRSPLLGAAAEAGKADSAVGAVDVAAARSYLAAQPTVAEAEEVASVAAKAVVDAALSQHRAGVAALQHTLGWEGLMHLMVGALWAERPMLVVSRSPHLLHAVAAG